MWKDHVVAQNTAWTWWATLKAGFATCVGLIILMMGVKCFVTWASGQVSLFGLERPRCDQGEPGATHKSARSDPGGCVKIRGEVGAPGENVFLVGTASISIMLLPGGFPKNGLALLGPRFCQNLPLLVINPRLSVLLWLLQSFGKEFGVWGTADVNVQFGCNYSICSWQSLIHLPFGF